MAKWDGLLKLVQGLFRGSPESLSGIFTLDQLRYAHMLHPNLSSLEASMYDSEGREYNLTYRVDIPTENVSDTERNLPTLEFRTKSRHDSHVMSLVDEPSYEGLAADIIIALDKNAKTKHAKTYGKKTMRDKSGTIVKGFTQVTVLTEPLTNKELLGFVEILPELRTDKKKLALTYRNVSGSAYKQALEAKLPLDAPPY